MLLTKGLMIAAILVLVYLLYDSVMNQPSTPVATTAASVETTTPAAPVETTTPAAPVETTTPAAPVETTTPAAPVETTTPAAQQQTEAMNNINYEPFEVMGYDVNTNLQGANVQDITSQPTTVNDDVLLVDGTDLLTAPLVDRFYSVNSISNVNRNASNDLRGDIPVEYNENYTPFYQSTIWGEPLTTHKLQEC
jgi:hypothetical protein